jgi:hypothetical protein
MLTVAEAIVGRLTAAPSIGVEADSIRRSHRIPTTREAAPAVNVIVQGIGEGKGKGCVTRALRVLIAVVVRSDDALDAADPIVEAVVARMAREYGAWPRGVSPRLVRVDVDEESADTDVMRVDVEYAFDFTAGEESLAIA